MKIHHFAIQVKDIDRSTLFYTEKLGFKIKTVKATTKDGHYSYLNLDLDGAELELIQIHGENEQADISSNSKLSLCPHIALETDDFDKDLQLLKERKVKIFDGPHIIPNDVKMMTILDPDGYRIDIGQLLR